MGQTQIKVDLHPPTHFGVKVSPIEHEYSIGLMEARKHSLYLMRFAAKLWLSFVHINSKMRVHNQRFESDFSASK